jgi:hypothetical protein
MNKLEDSERIARTSIRDTTRPTIKITNCTDSMFWYMEHINKEFEVIRAEKDRYWVREPNDWQCLNFVLKQDAELT